MAVENKNKRTWLKFLSKNSEVPLTEDEIRQVEEEIIKFFEIIENNNNVSAGLYIFVRSLNILMDHQQFKQKLNFTTEDIQLQFEKEEEKWKVGLHVLEAALTYRDLEKKVEVPIFRKNQQSSNKIIQL